MSLLFVSMFLLLFGQIDNITRSSRTSFFSRGIQEELFKEKNVTLCGFRAMIFKDQPLYFMGGGKP